MEGYLHLLKWMAEHPYFAVPLLMAEYALFWRLYYASGENKTVKWVLGAIFAPQNAVVNAVANSIIGLELPREWTTTERMKRWKKLSDKSSLNRWRIKYANWICDFANRYDPGHC